MRKGHTGDFGNAPSSNQAPRPVSGSRRHAEEEAVGGGTLVDPEQERAAAREREGQRADPFEISQEAGDRQQEIQEASSEDQEHARLEADRATIEVIRRVEVGASLAGIAGSLLLGGGRGGGVSIHTAQHLEFSTAGA